MAMPESSPVPVSNAAVLPAWARQIVDGFNSHAHSQFLLTGNCGDLFPVPAGDATGLGSLAEFIDQALVPRYNVVLTYDIGNGLRVARGGEVFGRWSEKPEALSKSPRQAIELITLYLRFCANLARLGQTRVKVAVILRDAQWIAPDASRHPDVDATAFLIREWSREPALTGHDIATFVIAENLSDLHSLVRLNPHAARVTVPLPAESEIRSVLERAAQTWPTALAALQADLADAARQLTGTTLFNLLGLLRLRQHQQQAIQPGDIRGLKARLVEQSCPDLIEFIPPKLTLDALHGQEALKRHLRQNVALWRDGRLDLIPMGYLICGPVGTGKTFLVKCLAGESGVPVVVLKNFRDKWYGSTEGNLEKIFRTLQALGRCYVFVDEADQTVGRRDTGGSEPAVSGRIYSLLAQEMSNKDNRGRIVWIFATSRPDLLEVDLKRPGRLDLKVPLFPTATPDEGFALLRAVAKAHEIELPETPPPDLRELIPDLMTPGEVDALLADLRREVLTEKTPVLEALRRRFEDYLKPVPLEVIERQIELAVQECSKAEFIPERFRPRPAVTADRSASGQGRGGAGPSGP
jgi:hypothetical protein